MTPTPSGPGESGGLVLLVERDPHVRELETFFLNGAGYTVAFAEDGVAALEMTRERKPALVITEILLPRLDGLALCRAIKREPALSATSVLVFSILAAHARAREAGADAFLIKPLAEQRLVQTVAQLLARPSPAPSTTQQSSPQ